MALLSALMENCSTIPSEEERKYFWVLRPVSTGCCMQVVAVTSTCSVFSMADKASDNSGNLGERSMATLSYSSYSSLSFYWSACEHCWRRTAKHKGIEGMGGIKRSSNRSMEKHFPWKTSDSTRAQHKMKINTCKHPYVLPLSAVRIALWIWVDVNSIVMNSSIDSGHRYHLLDAILFYGPNHLLLFAMREGLPPLNTTILLHLLHQGWDTRAIHSFTQPFS